LENFEYFFGRAVSFCPTFLAGRSPSPAQWGRILASMWDGIQLVTMWLRVLWLPTSSRSEAMSHFHSNGLVFSVLVFFFAHATYLVSEIYAQLITLEPLCVSLQYVPEQAMPMFSWGLREVSLGQTRPFHMCVPWLVAGIRQLTPGIQAVDPSRTRARGSLHHRHQGSIT
jgi:hypothetical protein